MTNCKKTITLTILMIFLFTLAPHATLNIYVDGEILKTQEAQPYIDEQNRTMIPLRAVTESLGEKVSWEASQQQARIGYGIRIPINSRYAHVYGNRKDMGTEATIRNGRTFVPLRFTSETLGYKVDYEPYAHGANINIGKSYDEPIPLDDYSTFYAQRMETSSNKKAVHRFAAAVENLEDSVVLPQNDMDDEELRTIIREAALYSPVGHHLTSSYRWNYRPGTVIVTMSYRVDKEDHLRVVREAGEKAKQLVHDNMSTEDKIEAINEYIASNVAYDHQTMSKATHVDAWDDRQAICSGYAILANVMLDAVGVESVMITGDADNGQGVGYHGWNLVKLKEGVWRHLDTTWNAGGVRSGNLQNYYLMTDSQIRRTHEWDRADYPAAN